MVLDNEKTPNCLPTGRVCGNRLLESVGAGGRGHVVVPRFAPEQESRTQPPDPVSLEAGPMEAANQGEG